MGKATYQQLLIMLGESYSSIRLLEDELFRTREALSEKMKETEKAEEKADKKKEKK